MEKDAFSDGGVAGLLADRFITCLVDCFDSSDLVRKYGVPGSPTMAILDPKGERIGIDPSGLPAAEFREDIETILGDYARLVGLREKASSEAQPALQRELGMAYHRLAMIDPGIKAFDRAAELFEEQGDANSALEILGWIAELKAQKGGPPSEIDAIAGRLEAADPDGKLGFKADGRYVRAIADLVAGRIDEADKKLAEVSEGHRIEEAAFLRIKIVIYWKKNAKAAAAACDDFLRRFPESGRRREVERILRAAAGDH